MLLFLTREALCSRSIEERRVGEGEPPRPNGLFSLLMEFRLRFCQKSRGDVAASRGEDWNGDESVPSVNFFLLAVLLAIASLSLE